MNVIVAKSIVLVTIQIYWFRPENNMLLMPVDAMHAKQKIVMGLISIHFTDHY